MVCGGLKHPFVLGMDVGGVSQFNCLPTAEWVFGWPQESYLHTRPRLLEAGNKEFILSCKFVLILKIVFTHC